ncbi:MAG: hypothetical protein NT094_01345 [Candidatus Staskawiczbacteria bacterium]|nr:hypothetical protein [Candidatus Staskawiczbacteria bacterium]
MDSKKILIIEDDEFLRQLISKKMSTEGFVLMVQMVLKKLKRQSQI